MKNQEIIFKCRHCNNNIYYKQHICTNCKEIIDWLGINLMYEDKYLEIYEVSA